MRTPKEPLAWSEAVREKDSLDRERFLESHVDLVKYLAVRLAARLPSSVEIDDLVNDGILGLIDATDRYDPGRAVRFRTYAETRIRGAILDGLRRKDWRPRSVRHKRRNLDAALSELSSLHHRAATEEEIACAMGVDVEGYRAMLADLNGGPLLSLEELPPGADPAVTDEAYLPSRCLERAELLESLADEVARLPEREQRVLDMYYCRALNLKEIGAVLGVTESRVCQLHAQAAARLRGGIQRRMSPVGAGTAVAGRSGRR